MIEWHVRFAPYIQVENFKKLIMFWNEYKNNTECQIKQPASQKHLE